MAHACNWQGRGDICPIDYGAFRHSPGRDGAAATATVYCPVSHFSMTTKLSQRVSFAAAPLPQRNKCL